MVYHLTENTISGFEAAVQTSIKEAIEKEKHVQETLEAPGESKNKERFDEQHKFIIIGLHTCGDLALKVPHLES